VKLTPRALRRARIITTWWQKHRPGAEEVFEQEFEHVIDRLALMSPLGPVGKAHGPSRGRTIWRVLLPKSQQHLYYSINEAKGIVVVHTIWGARRGHSPKL
jgi:plasmid stabilization system protein ParE